MKIINKIKTGLKKVNKALMTVSNFIITLIIYVIGGSLSFMAFKVSSIGRKEIKEESYWIKYEEDEKKYRQF